MRFYQRTFKKLLNIIISSNLRHILIQIIGFNNYISLIIKFADIKGNTRAKKNILCVEKSLFEKDVDELSHRIRNYGWIWLSKRQITVYQDKIIPRKYRGQKVFKNYLKEIPEEWRKCIEMSKILIKRFKKEKKICALLLANVNYSQDYALQVACKELQIPVIVLQKEYPYNDLGYYERFKKQYVTNSTIIADAVMVFGKRMKNILSELKSFDENKIFVTGAPRIDRWRSLEMDEAINKEGLLIISFKDDEKKIEPFFEMIFHISNYFKKEKLGSITLKSRNEAQSRQLSEYCKKKNIDNIEIVHYANIYDLVLQSKVVVSLNSLATVECMLSKVPIIIPNWIIINKINTMFDRDDEFCSKSLEFSENIENLMNRIGKHLRSNNSRVSDKTFEARKKFISNFWEYDPKVTSCNNVQNVINNLTNN